MTALNPLRGTLPDRTSYVSGRWQWLPESATTGVLEIVITTGRRDPRATWHRYGVTLLAPGRFELVKLDGDRVGEVYECSVGGEVATCGCVAGTYDQKRAKQVGCRHRETLAALLKQQGDGQ